MKKMVILKRNITFKIYFQINSIYTLLKMLLNRYSIRNKKLLRTSFVTGKTVFESIITLLRLFVLQKALIPTFKPNN